MTYGPPAFLCAAFSAGVASHVGFFMRGEHHLHSVTYLKAFLLINATSTILLVKWADCSAAGAFKIVATYVGFYLAGTYTSLILYRAFFHPLRHFPGPFMARITAFWLTMQLGDSDTYKQILQLHRRYGDYVRVGPSDLSIADPEGVTIIYGTGSKCRKAAWYGSEDGIGADLNSSLFNERNKESHDRRRRFWSPAFSDKALRGYEGRIQTYIDQLIQRLTASSGEPVDMSHWFNLFSYDVMGDLAFGKSFGMLQSGDEHFAIKLLHEGQHILAYLLPPWFLTVLVSIPGLAAGYYRFLNYCTQQLVERMKAKPSIPDIMSPLLERFANREPDKKEFAMLQGDSRLIIVAGSDTTATTLVHIFYYLARDPAQIKKLREEMSPKVDQGGGIHNRDIQDLSHLNGVINEALRLHPPVPSVVPRLTPPEGIQIGEVTVPGNMTVWCPQYAIGRMESVYTNADAFVPERWCSKPEMVKNKHAFAPFSLGTYSCIGKPLALMELRIVTAKVVMAFDIELASGEDGTTLIEKSRDHFTMECGKLNLCFRERVDL